jgi:hypothetical protein
MEMNKWGIRKDGGPLKVIGLEPQPFGSYMQGIENWQNVDEKKVCLGGNLALAFTTCQINYIMYCNTYGKSIHFRFLPMHTFNWI